jgi:DNA-3-methyladenine glycosylase II
MTGDAVAVWPEATERFREDPALGPLVEKVGPVRLRPPRGAPFESLAAAIVYQQLAGKAALAIHRRFVDALGDAVTPERVLEAPDVALRGAGLSGNKLAAIRDLAARTASGELELDGIAELKDDQVVERLSRVRGVGPWTAQMFLIFDLHRPDVWPTGDLGVRNGLGRILALEVSPSPRDMEWIGTGYRPWRSALAWYCWQAVRVLTPGGGPAPEG